MSRVCPHTDAVCRHGMACQYSCATDEYDGTKRPTDLLATDEPSLADDVARLNRWLDREHHRFPSSPLAAPTARVLSALTAATDEAERLRAVLVRIASVEHGWNKPHRVTTARGLLDDAVNFAKGALAKRLAPQEPTDAD